LEIHKEWIYLQVANAPLGGRAEASGRSDEGERRKARQLVLECALQKKGKAETPKQSGDTPTQQGRGRQQGLAEQSAAGQTRAQQWNETQTRHEWSDADFDEDYG
jgi:hypothetical protein